MRTCQSKVLSGSYLVCIDAVNIPVVLFRMPPMLAVSGMFSTNFLESVMRRPPTGWTFHNPETSNCPRGQNPEPSECGNLLGPQLYLWVVSGIHVAHFHQNPRSPPWSALGSHQVLKTGDSDKPHVEHFIQNPKQPQEIALVLRENEIPCEYESFQRNTFWGKM